MAQTKIVQTARREQLGDFAPEFAHLDDVLFSEMCSGTYKLSPKQKLSYHYQSVPALNNITDARYMINRGLEMPGLNIMGGLQVRI